MKKKPLLYYEDDEIDLIKFFYSFWDNKVKIFLITAISFLIGFGYNYLIPSNYINSLVIKKSDNSEFNAYSSVENFFNTNHKDKTNLVILDRFLSELQDYEEFIHNLKTSKKVIENINNLPIEDQEKELFQYANLLEIVASKKDGSYSLNFTWDNVEEARNILQGTMDLVLSNLENSIYGDLEKSLELKKKITLNDDLIRLNYLNEQSSIAKELDIKDNQIDNVNLSQSNVSLNINTADIAYYLRGHKAIDKEIQLIRDRSYDSLKFIAREIKSLKKENIKWIDYNSYLMNARLLKNTKKILIISILLGLLVGIFYVIVDNALQSRSIYKKRH